MTNIDCVISLILAIFAQLFFYVWLLDHSILLKARHDELNHEFITLHNHELILRLTAISRSQLKSKREKLFLPTGI